MSKAHDPHWRYVALALEGRPPSRRGLQNALLGRARKEGVPDEEAPQLTRFDWPHAIVRVHHHRLADARDWLPRVGFTVDDGVKHELRVQTIGASGTIKALTTRLGVLQQRGPASKKRQGKPSPARGRTGVPGPTRP